MDITVSCEYMMFIIAVYFISAAVLLLDGLDVLIYGRKEVLTIITLEGRNELTLSTLGGCKKPSILPQIRSSISLSSV